MKDKIRGSDVVDTIIKTEFTNGNDSMSKLMIKLGINQDRVTMLNSVMTNKGLNNEKNIISFFKDRFGVSVSKKHAQEYIEDAAQEAGDLKLFDGVTTLFDELDKRHIPVALITNMNELRYDNFSHDVKNIFKRAKYLAISSEHGVLKSGLNSSLNKSDSNLYHALQEKYPNINLKKLTMIGDSVKEDIHASLSSGIQHAYLLRHEDKKRELSEDDIKILDELNGNHTKLYKYSHDLLDIINY